MGSLTLGRQFSPCLWPGVGAGCLRVGLGLLASELWKPLSSCNFAWCLREGLRRTQGEPWCWNCENMGFQGLSPAVQLTLYATGISMSKAPKSPPLSAHLSLSLSARPIGTTSSWTSQLRCPTDTPNSTPPKLNSLLPMLFLLFLFPSSVNDTSNPPHLSISLILLSLSSAPDNQSPTPIDSPSSTHWDYRPSLLVPGLFPQTPNRFPCLQVHLLLAILPQEPDWLSGNTKPVLSLHCSTPCSGHSLPTQVSSPHQGLQSLS